MQETFFTFTIGNVISILIFLLSGFGAVIKIQGFIDGKFEKVNKETDAKVGTVFRRFDDFKLSAESKFVDQKICSLTHRGESENYNRLENKLDKLSGFVEKLCDKLEKITIAKANQ